MSASPNPRIFDGDGAPKDPPPAYIDPKANRDATLSDRGYRLIECLKHWAWFDNPDCWPSRATLAKTLGWSERKVTFAVADAIQAGYLQSRYETIATGRRRVYTLTARVKTLALFDPDPCGGGSRNDRRDPGATPCATPAQPLARPVAQGVAPRNCSNSKGEEKEQPPADRPPQKRRPSGWLLTPEEAPEENLIADSDLADSKGEEKEQPPADRPPQKRRPSGWLLTPEEAPEENLIADSDLADWIAWRDGPGVYKAIRAMAVIALSRHERAVAELARRKTQPAGSLAKEPPAGCGNDHP